MAETFITTLLPVEIRLPPNKLVHVSESPLLDIFGAYEEHPDGFQIPRGLKIVTSGSFPNMNAAETFARELSMTWMAMMCFVMGVKASLPRVECVLQRIDKGGRYRIRTYFYGTMLVSANLPLDVDLLTRNREHIAALPEQAMERVALAVRWYTVGLGQADDLNRFLSYWIGLEAVGHLLHNSIHKFDKAPCEVCAHPAGKDRDGKKAGMQHAIAVVSGHSDLFNELENARNKLFHGLEEIQMHRQTIVSNVIALETALARAILEVIKPQDSNEPVSASVPLRTAGTTPQAIFEGTLISLTDEERDLILYHQAVRVMSKIESGQNDEDGGLTLNVKPGFSVLEGLDSRLVDRHFSWVSAPGVGLRQRRE